MVLRFCFGKARLIMDVRCIPRCVVVVILVCILSTHAITTFQTLRGIAAGMLAIELADPF